MEYLVEKRIIDIVGRGLRQTYRMIADQIPATRNTADKYIRRMMARGLITREGKGRKGAFVYKVNKTKAEELGYL